MADENTQGQQGQQPRQTAGMMARRRSDVYEHFICFTDVQGNAKARCRYCDHVLGASTKNGTSTLRAHVRICKARDVESSNPTSSALPQPQSLPQLLLPGLGELSHREPAGPEEDEAMPLLQPSGPGEPSDREPASPEEDEASKDLARMIVFHGYDPSVVEDDYFRSFVRRLNPGFELPSREAIEEMCDGIFDGTREDLFSRISDVPGMVSLSVGTFRTMEGEVLYTVCHFIDDQWKLHRVIMDAYVHGDFGYSYGPLLGAQQVLFSPPDSPEDDRIEDVIDGFSKRDVLDNLFMMVWETTGDNGIIYLRNKIERNKMNANPTRTTLISTTFMDKVIHSIARKIALYITFDDEITYDLDDLGLTRQNRQKIISELGLDDNLWAYGEDWYWTYCSLQVLRKEGCTRTDTGSEFAELYCKLCGEIHRAIQRISASSCPTSNICLVELFKLRQVLQSQVARASTGDTAAAYKSCDPFLDLQEDNYVANVLREATDCLDRSIKDSYLIWSIPLILDPRYKLSYIEFIFRWAFVDSEATSCISEVKRQIEKLYTDYIQHGAITDNANPDDLVTAMAARSSNDPLREAWEEHCRLQYGMTTEVIPRYQDAETELDRYLKDRPAPQTESFDILKWWKDNSWNYPTVARMARDALAMPTCSKLSSEQMAHVRSIIRGYSKAAFRCPRQESPPWITKGAFR